MREVQRQRERENMKEERKQEGLPPVDSRTRVRFRALGIIRNANRAAQQAAMALAYLEANNEGSDQLAREGLEAALDYLEVASQG